MVLWFIYNSRATIFVERESVLLPKQGSIRDDVSLLFDLIVIGLEMAKRRKKVDTRPEEMWINPNSSLKGARGERAWENRSGKVPNSSRYLEMADIALGLKKPAAKKKATPVHETIKLGPYTKE